MKFSVFWSFTKNTFLCKTFTFLKCFKGSFKYYVRLEGSEKSSKKWYARKKANGGSERSLISANVIFEWPLKQITYFLKIKVFICTLKNTIWSLFTEFQSPVCVVNLCEKIKSIVFVFELFNCLEMFNVVFVLKDTVMNFHIGFWTFL